ncbi:hypothetical protein N7508_010278 [Penicillium antarcticum]|uniref:uncharacterized protein n=1 Tax=Penicillium antarcticum TaxID=416450 RepID=UPI0023822E09|nr:uncharacterized protein N7508_010278 [Penicillium antarcticum]KAJ5295457.1 hypothetical protein N7508_010278 [Penicillium antarcticum]
MNYPPSDNPKERQHALNFAYMYGYPLLEYGKFVAQFPNACTNTLYHDRRLSTSNDLKIIRPNSDTLYSTIFMDLSSNDLQIIIPELPDRYWVYPFYDLYGNDIGNISSLQGHRAGKYLIRHASENFGLFLGPPPECENDADISGYVNLPTPYGICFARFATTQAIQDQEAVSPLNPSPVLEDRQCISDTLTRSGMKDGVFTCPERVDISQAPQFAEIQARDGLQAPGGRMDFGNGWDSAFPECMGNFGSNYAARYYIAKFGYLGVTSDQAIYPSRPQALRFEHDEAVLVRFSRRPVLLMTGFWSLTAYDADQYLVKNNLNRYVLGDRDDMTFPDGARLDDENKDGEFFILLQPADVPPPAQWKNHWLPSPAGGGKMSITLRLYGIKQEMISKSYEYPRLEYIKAITDSAKSLL